jgi:hypothetical protein
MDILYEPAVDEEREQSGSLSGREGQLSQDDNPELIRREITLQG